MLSWPSRSKREANWETLARILRWERTTPLGSPELPEVKRSRASSRPPVALMPRSLQRAGAGRSFERMNHLVMVLLMRGRVRSRKMRLASRGPGEGLHFADEGIRGEEAVDAGLADRGLDGFRSGGEVDIDRGFAGDESGEVGDERAFAGREDDADPWLVGLLGDDFAEGDGGGEEFVVAEFGAVEAIDEPRPGAVFFDAVDEGEAEVALEEWPVAVGAF